MDSCRVLCFTQYNFMSPPGHTFIEALSVAVASVTGGWFVHTVPNTISVRKNIYSKTEMRPYCIGH